MDRIGRIIRVKSNILTILIIHVKFVSVNFLPTNIPVEPKKLFFGNKSRSHGFGLPVKDDQKVFSHAGRRFPALLPFLQCADAKTEMFRKF